MMLWHFSDFINNPSRQQSEVAGIDRQLTEKSVIATVEEPITETEPPCFLPVDPSHINHVIAFSKGIDEQGD